MLANNFILNLKKIETYNENFEEKFTLYKQNLMLWNKKINLISNTTLNIIENKHFSQALALYPLLVDKGNIQILDIGTGAGFPGLPLAITLPEQNFTLLDKVQKKIAFINSTLTQLKIKNVNALHQRVENLNYQYDIIICRAFAATDKIINLTQQLLKKNAKIFIVKTGNYELEKSDNIANCNTKTIDLEFNEIKIKVVEISII